MGGVQSAGTGELSADSVQGRGILSTGDQRHLSLATDSDAEEIQSAETGSNWPGC